MWSLCTKNWHYGFSFIHRYSRSNSLYTWLSHTCHWFVHFALGWAVFRLCPFLKKCTKWPQMTLTCSRSKISIYMLHAPARPNLRKSTLNDPQRPWYVQDKNTNIHAKYTPEAQIFFCSTLGYSVFELQPDFWKNAANDSKWPWHLQGQKYQHACYICPRYPDFRPFHSTVSHF